MLYLLFSDCSLRHQYIFFNKDTFVTQIVLENKEFDSLMASLLKLLPCVLTGQEINNTNINGHDNA